MSYLQSENGNRLEHSFFKKYSTNWDKFIDKLF